jgi:2-polyprenyl-3-methyl-5-hydroxy-6-metoxy-1,4-benzoquinol methylase
VPADLVCCIDVLEHIEPEYLSAVLSHLASLTKNLAFLTIHSAPAIKILPDGRNAHLIIKPMSWWTPTLGLHFDVVMSEPDEQQDAFWVLAKRRID